MLKDTKGNRLYRSVSIKIIFPDKIFPDRKLLQHAPPSRGFNDDSLDEIIGKVVDQLDTLYPFWEFKLLPLAHTPRQAKYVIAFAGYRADVIERMKKEQEAAADAPVPENPENPAQEATPEPVSSENEFQDSNHFNASLGGCV
jgi:hypothetical protein